MRKKKPQAERKPRAKKAAPVSSEPALAPAAAPAHVFTSTYPLAFDGGPPPEVIFLEAEAEPDFCSLSQYVDSIRVLRQKKFSYREIAEWLSGRGVAADHNSVYRVYTKNLDDYGAAFEALQAKEEEERDGMRSR